MIKKWTYRNQTNTIPFVDRFWEKVSIGGSSDCWEWQAFRNHDGYGMIGMNGKSTKANRAVWILTYGSIPEGMDVLHICDNPACCNPAHLFLGTQTDNNRDRHAKGRSNAPKGEAHWKAILTAKKVIEIRNAYTTGKYSHRELAEIYGIEKSTIGRIIRRQLWRSV